MISMRVLSDNFVAEHMTMARSIQLVEAAFAASALRAAVVFPVVVEFIPEQEAMFGIKSGYLSPAATPAATSVHTANGLVQTLGLKAGGYWMRNQERFGLPGHTSVMLLFDMTNGSPVALVAANAITSLRTGAAGGVAAKHLARPESRIAAVIGAGDQARMQVHALREVRPIEELRVWARRPEAAEQYASEWGASGLRVQVVPDVRDAVAGADVVITTTPSFEPLVRDAYVAPGTHVNAIGSDARGKRELETELLRRSKVVVDRLAQSVAIGEMQHAVNAGLLTPEAVHAELGEVCAGLKPGRTTEDEITVFDSSGVTIQDLALAGYLYDKALAEDLGEKVSL
jgi:alanine dehydrogenase